MCILARWTKNPGTKSIGGISAVAGAEYFRDEEKRHPILRRYVPLASKRIMSYRTILGQVPSEGGYEPTI